ncbi:MAG: hypothetical protein MJ238_06685, partial [Bacilli bacterium]|nr:hypothetical protein [Bacilli bacterium]
DGEESNQIGNYIDEEANAESKRLFYVAYTRAKYIMILPNYNCFGVPFLKETFNEFFENNPDEYKSIKVLPETTKIKMWGDDVKEILAKNSKNSLPDGDSNETAEKQNKELQKIFKIKPQKMTYKHSYSSLSHTKAVEERNGDEEVSVVDKEGYAIADSSGYDTKGVSVPTNVDPSLPQVLCPKNFPKGNKVGSALHRIFENIEFTDVSEDVPPDFEKLTNRCFRLEGLDITKKESWMDYIKKIVINTLNAKLPVINGANYSDGESMFCLNELPRKDRKTELEFNFNLKGERLKNYSNGFIDLVFRRGERFSIIDWKSDGINDENLHSYSKGEDLKLRVDSCYSIQRVLYSYCLIKWLGQYYEGDDETIFNEHFGGVYYIFIRGCSKGTGNGVYAHTWKTWSDLESAFNNIIEEKIGGKRNGD